MCSGAACASDASAPSDDGGPLSDDGGLDAGSDAGTPLGDGGGADAGVDSGTPSDDGGSDGGVDSGTPFDDGGTDAGADSGTPPGDGGTDGGADSGTPPGDGGSDAGSAADAGGDGGVDSGTPGSDGGVDSGVVGGDAGLLTVGPAYPVNGAQWMDYVKNDGADAFGATDTACAGTELGATACLHGGELRKVPLPGVYSCTGLALADVLGAFDWACRLEAGVATFYTTGLQTGRGLKDLVNASGWKSEAVVLTGTWSGASLASPWWTNPVVPLPDNSAAPVLPLDGVNNGGNDAVFASGTVFTLATSRATRGYNLNLDRLALVTFTGATLSLASGATQNCNQGSTGEVAAPDSICLVAAGSQKFLWVEGSFDGSTGTGKTDAVVLSVGNTFSRFHGLDLVSGKGVSTSSNSGLDLEDGASNSVTQFNAVACTGNINGYGLNLNGETYTSVATASASGFKAGTASVIAGFHLNGARYNSLIGLSANDNKVGVYLEYSSTYNLFSNVVATNSVADGVYGNWLTDSNTFLDITANDNGANGIYLNTTGANTLRRIWTTNNGLSGWGVGLTLQGATGAQIFDLVTGHNCRGLQLQQATGVLVNRITASDNYNAEGILLVQGSGTVIVQAVLVNNRTGISAGSSAANLISQATLVNNRDVGLALTGGAASSSNTLHQAVVANSTTGILFTGTGVANSTFSQLAAVSNGDGINLVNCSNGGKFTGNLVVGGNTSKDCALTGGTNPGLVDTTCTSTGADGSSSYPAGNASDAVLRTGRSMATSIVGKLSAGDTTNLFDDATGGATFPASSALVDWNGFDSPFRAWGVDGSAFPNNDHRGPWASGAGRIWDFRLRASDSTLLNRSGDGSSANAALVPGAACPAPAGGSVTATDLQAPAHTYLLSAVEVVDPAAPEYSAAGNHNGLCESNEHCVYTPNFGAYQGHGALGTCVFTDGTVAGVTLFGYSQNGL